MSTVRADEIVAAALVDGGEFSRDVERQAIILGNGRADIAQDIEGEVVFLGDRQCSSGT
jgi:hypothetical protein